MILLNSTAEFVKKQVIQPEIFLKKDGKNHKYGQSKLK